MIQQAFEASLEMGDAATGGNGLQQNLKGKMSGIGKAANNMGKNTTVSEKKALKEAQNEFDRLAVEKERRIKMLSYLKDSGDASEEDLQELESAKKSEAWDKDMEELLLQTNSVHQEKRNKEYSLDRINTLRASQDQEDPRMDRASNKISEEIRDKQELIDDLAEEFKNSH